jgi:Domain of unknown function (DUF4263)
MASSPLVQDWKEPARRMRHEMCDRHFARHYERHSTREKINEKESAAHELDDAREPKWRKQLELIEHCDVLENARAWPSRAYSMLQRNLLYTGVTRGKRLVVLVGQRKAVAIGTKLILDEEYRDGVHKIAPDFANSVLQVLDQRYRFVTHIAALQFDSRGNKFEGYSVDCVVVAGRTPDNADQQKALELYRGAFKDVSVLTFDELRQRLVTLRNFLSSDRLEPLATADTPLEMASP